MSLTKEQVDYIFEKRGTMKLKDIAAKAKVSYVSVHNYLTGKREYRDPKEKVRKKAERWKPRSSTYDRNGFFDPIAYAGYTATL